MPQPFTMTMALSPISPDTAWPPLRWSAIEQAQQRRVPRVPLHVDGIVVGSVASAHLTALRMHPRTLRCDERGVTLLAAVSERDEALAELNRWLRGEGLIHAWRDEIFALPDPRTLQPLAQLERAAARFWGTLTFGAHCNGFVADASGRPQHLWVAQRALDKATDPGLFDNLVGGGVPAGQTPRDTLWREAWEEAGLTRPVIERARPGRVLRLERDIPEGLQFEQLHVFDLQLQLGEVPSNQDGEVAGFRLLPAAQVLELAAGTTMTVDAALVTLDFALRHRLLLDASLAARVAALWVDP